MMSWFESLDDRERLFVATAAVFVVLAVIWFGLWLPLDRGQKAAAANVEVWKNSLSELRPLRGQIQASGGSQPIAAAQNQSLVVIVDTSLRQRSLTNALQSSQPTPGGNGIRIEFEGAAFDDLMLWLGDVNRQYGLLVASGSFSRETDENQGRVRATMTLER